MIFFFLSPGTGYAYVIYNETFFENLNETSQLTNDHVIVPLSKDQQDLSISCKSSTEAENDEFLVTLKPDEDFDLTENSFTVDSKELTDTTTMTSSDDFSTSSDLWDKSTETKDKIWDDDDDDFWNQLEDTKSDNFLNPSEEKENQSKVSEDSLFDR